MQLGMVVDTCSPGYPWGWGMRITWIREAEITMSQDCATALQAGQQSETVSPKKKKKQKQSRNYYDKLLY